MLHVVGKGRTIAEVRPFSINVICPFDSCLVALLVLQHCRLSRSHFSVPHCRALQVTRDLDKQRKAYEASTIGKLANLGTQFNKLVGGEGSESEPESDVRPVYCNIFFHSTLCCARCMLYCGTLRVFLRPVI
jgi:hypothetical protein